MNTAAFTIVTRNYLHQARTLMRSVQRHMPGAARYVLLVDRPEDQLDVTREPFHAVFADELGLPNFPQLAFINDATSMCCLLKPAFALHLLSKSDAHEFLYLDGDTAMYAPPSSIFETLGASPFVLTPHVLRPVPDNAQVTNGHIARSGVYNAGVFAFKRSEDASSILRWWLRNMLHERYLDPVFSRDQVWLNLVPLFFPSVGILADPSCNVAYWNIHEREIRRSAVPEWLVFEQRLVIFHYSLFDRRHPGFLTWKPWLKIPVSGTLAELTASYAADLDREAAGICESWGYSFSRFRDGQPIHPAQREYYRDHPIAPDPFAATDRTLRLLGNGLYRRLSRMSRMFFARS